MNDPNQVQVNLMNNGGSQQLVIQQELQETYTTTEPAYQQAPPPTQEIHETKPIIDQKPNIEQKPNIQRSSSSKKDKKREAIDGQAREIIYKVIKFFESEKQNRGYAFPVDNVMRRASAATGLSESTIKRIKRDGLKAEATNTKMTGPKKRRMRKTKVQLDYYQLCALRGIVNAYSNRKEVPTLSKILASAKNDLNYRGGKESLRLILLNKLGIKFKKCEKKEKKPVVVPQEQKPQIISDVKYTQVNMQPPETTMQNNTIHHNMHPPQHLQPNMIHHQMHPMKMEETNCVYTNLMTQAIGL